MKRRRTKLLSIVLALMLLAGTFSVNTGEVSASVVKKVSKSYDIAVVFDNSGSMYNNTDAWCKAKYAMEVFASMMPYGKNDSLRIYPMWEVETKGETSGTYDPISINSVDDIDKIHEMYTIRRGETPFEPVRDAYNDLNKSNADNKWLIVLTDGAFNKDNRDDPAQNGAVDVQGELEKYASGDIKVQYLGLGEKADSLTPSGNLYAMKATNKSLSKDLITICNNIFQRATLPADCVKDNGKLNLTMSMNKLIVFAQGKNVKIKSLKGGKGEIPIKDSRNCKYSKKSTDGKYKKVAKVDKSLSGQVVTFGSCKRGSYKLDMKGVNKNDLEIFYEPDVNIKVTLTDTKDNNAEPVELTNADGFSTGKYTIDYALIDNQTGKDVSNSKLLGKVTYDGKLVYSNGDEKKLKPGDPFILEPDGDAFVDVSATYLKDYVISTNAMKDAYTISVSKNKAKKLKMKLDVTQTMSWYKRSDQENWKPIRAKLEYNGRDMTDEELEQVKMTCDFDGKNMEYTTEPVKGQSAIDIYPGKTESGEYVQPEKGKYKMTANASYTAPRSKASKDSAKENFTVSDMGWLLGLLRWLIPLLALIAFLLWWNLRKALPKRVYFTSRNFGTSNIKAKKKGMALSGKSYPGEIICDTEPLTKHIARKKSAAKFAARNLVLDQKVESFTIGYGNEFTRNGDRNFEDPMGTKLTAQTKFNISNGTPIVWTVKGKPERKGTIHINVKKKHKGKKH